MKNWYSRNFNNVFFGLFLTIIISIGFDYFYGSENLLQFILPTIIPVFSGVYLIKYKFQNIPFIFFLFFSFLGNAFGLVNLKTEDFYILNITSLAALVSLIFISGQKFKVKEVHKLVGIYLLTVFTISLFFVYEVIDIFRYFILEDTDFYMFVLNCLGLLVFAFMSLGYYLNTQTKSAILFLTAAICFAFTSLVDYFVIYFAYNWNFIFLHKLLYVVGLYQIIKFMIEEHSLNRLKPIEDYEVYYSEITFA
ncbi:hypothetical protein [Tamlana flava]|uniref:hypothetical protein n=1 Tax=Tamlana flava TaxID=3158572 RepID=UPI00351B4547